MSWERDPMSWERDKKKFTCPLSAAVDLTMFNRINCLRTRPNERMCNHRLRISRRYVTAILMDLSNMFLKGYQGLGCLPHQLLISKLKAYGLAEEVVKLLESCLGDMSQQIIWEPLQVHGRNFLWESLGDLSWDLYFLTFLSIICFIL